MTTKELRNLINMAFYYESEATKEHEYLKMLEMFMNDMADFELALVDLRAWAEENR